MYLLFIYTVFLARLHQILNGKCPLCTTKQTKDAMSGLAYLQDSPKIIQALKEIVTPTTKLPKV